MKQYADLSTAPRPHRRQWRIYTLQIKSELLKQCRIPFVALTTVAFPLMFYILFSLIVAGEHTIGQVRAATYLLATYSAFGVIGVALFSFGVGVSLERGMGWLRLQRATPMPPMAYFVAKLVISLANSIAIVATLFAAGFLLGRISLDPPTWLALAGILVLGALPFCAFGLALGYLIGPNSSPVVVNAIYLPMAFASGLWIPIESLPGFMQTIALALPSYHYAQMALGTLGAGHGEVWSHLAVLALFTIASLLAASFGYRRDEGQTYG